MFIATLIAADDLTRGDISLAEDALRAAGLAPLGTKWVEEGKACDISFESGARTARAALEGVVAKTDVVIQLEERRRRKLLVADMDSTMITVECIDELADYAGVKAEIAEVTERAMRGELDFEAALDARVAMLKGLDESVIDRCHAERVRLTPGAVELVRTTRRAGGHCLLVSGGFTRFTDKVAAEIGFDRAVANVLHIEGGQLTGTVARPIVGTQSKRDALVETAASLGIGLDWTMAIGDGANDIPMIEAAGLGVSYRAKPAAAAAADARIEHNDLTALLYAQGYPRSEWEGAR